MLYEEKNYTIGLNYLFNNYIREYDISKANISVLYSKGVIDESLYTKLYNSDRMYRQVYIGKAIQRNPEIQDILNAGIIEYKQKFFEANGINDNDIVSIKNDAVFVLNKLPTVFTFDKVTFSHKNTYNSFMKINELEVYYYGDCFGEQIIDIKGIKDKDLETYHMGFLNIIITFLEIMQRGGASTTLQWINDLIQQYVRLELPIQMYRRFRSSNDYVLNSKTCGYSIYYLEDNIMNKRCLDITHNFGILRLLQMYASQVLYEEKVR